MRLRGQIINTSIIIYYSLSFVLALQYFFYLIVKDHEIVHIGQSSIALVSILFFLFGVLSNFSRKVSFIDYLLIPLSMLSFGLKVLWSGGLYSPFLSWFLILPIIIFIFERNHFKLVFNCFVFVISSILILYYIKLDQVNFAHLIYGISPFIYYILFLIPFSALVMNVFMFKRLSQDKLSFFKDINKSDIINRVEKLNYLLELNGDIESLNNEVRISFNLNNVLNKDRLDDYLILFDLKLRAFNTNNDITEFILVNYD